MIARVGIVHHHYTQVNRSTGGMNQVGDLDPKTLTLYE